MSTESSASLPANAADAAADVPAGLLIVISAPSGAGKTSLVNALVRDDPNIRVSVSHTTRPKRPSENDGVHYHFVSRSEFARMQAAQDFVESAEVFGNYYGTSRQALAAELAAGHDLLLEIDWQGAQQVRQRFPEALTLFILPPSRETLIDRLHKRGQDDEAVIAKRTAKAVEEMSHHSEYDYLIVNDDFEQALSDIKTVVHAERLRTRQQRVRLRALLVELLS
jgi:guanylate kinase